MSPGSRKWKSGIANVITANIKEYHLTQEDEVEVLSLAMKNLGILDKSIFLRKPTKSGCKLTDLMTWQEVWKFWHDQSIPSANTQQIVKLRVIEKPGILSNLEYVSTVWTVQQMNRAFYQSIHQIVEKPFRELYHSTNVCCISCKW